MPTYNLYALGTLKPNTDRTIALKQLQTRFKLSQQKAERLLGNKPILIKSSPDFSMLERYSQQLNSVGLECIIKPAKQIAADTSKLSKTSSESVQAWKTHNAITHPSLALKPHNLQEGRNCPKCNRLSQNNDECSHCGIIFDRYHALQQRRASSAEQKKSPSIGRHNSYSNGQDRFNFILNKSLLIPLCGLSLLFAFKFMGATTANELGESQLAAANLAFIQQSIELKHMEIDQLRTLISRRQYQALISELASLDERSRNNIIWEYALFKHLDLYHPKNGLRRQQLDDFVDSTQSAYAYLARAYFLLNQGWESRGSDWSSPCLRQR